MTALSGLAQRGERSCPGKLDGGLSIVEVMVAIVIFMIVMSGVLAGVLQSLNMTRDSRARQTAANMAAEEIDTVRAAKDFGTVSGDTSTRTLNGETFTVLRTVTPRFNGGSASPCDGGADPRLVSFKAVNVRVTWENMGSTAPVRADTIITPGVGSFDPDKGNVAIKVLNAQASGVEGVSVTLAGSTTSTTELTDEDGCVFLVQVVPGSYTVSISASNYVDPARVSTPTRSLVVNPGSTVSSQFDYDEAATLELSLPTAEYPAPTNVPLTLFNSRLLPSGTLRATGTGAVRRVTPLFPFTSGYSVWAGSCADADPEGVRVDSSGRPIGRYYDGAIRPRAVPAVPGGVTSGNVNMGEIRVSLTRARQLQIRAVHGADPGCPPGEVYILGTTNSRGELDASLPWGTWRIEAVRASPTSSWPSVTLNPTNQDPVDVRVSIW